MTTLRLPLLATHEAALETCVYCPKLCRAACPVSNVEPVETLIPWGKMSTAYFAARGDAPVDAEHAATAWACTGCLGCRERCDHDNPVAMVLGDARADFFARGVAPAAAREVARGFDAGAAAHAERVRALGASKPGSRVALLVGCGYVEHAPDVARDAVRVTQALTGHAPRLVEACCGLPLLHAGDRAGFLRAARKLEGEVAGAERLVVLDPGCARLLRQDAARLDLQVPTPELVVELAHTALDQLRSSVVSGPVRYHDPCQLGRGLGLYEEPRALLLRVTGSRPGELARHHGDAVCSGGGGLLPRTMPAVSRAIADGRLAEHRAAGGGTLVTACASSLVRFRTRGERAVDLCSLVAAALPERVT